MSLYTKSEIETLDIESPFGVIGNVSSYIPSGDIMDAEGPFGPVWAIVPSSPSTFDATRFFLVF